MTEQLILLEGVRIEPPACYDDVVTSMLTAFSNQPQMKQWGIDKLASDIWQFGNLNGEPDPEDVARSVRIYRERNQDGN